MSDGLIPQRYARALYKYALEHNNATAVYDEMKQVADSFEAFPEMQKVMTKNKLKISKLSILYQLQRIL